MYLNALLGDILKVHLTFKSLGLFFLSFTEQKFVANTQDLITDSHLDVIET